MFPLRQFCSDRRALVLIDPFDALPLSHVRAVIPLP
jgi:hypothetical protein